jgi:hypothetical protein
MSRLIDFFVIGAAKAGTSALHRYCVKHPEISGGIKKEIHFFDHYTNFLNLPVNYDNYHNMFDFTNNKKFYADFTPDYIYFEESAQLIWEYNRNAKIIAILRNPIDRAFSQWNMYTEKKLEDIPFGDAIRNERLRTRAYLPNWHGHYSYIDRGFYSEQIRRYQRFFPKEQLLFIKYEDFKHDQAFYLKRVFEFIGANPDTFQYEHLVANQFKYESSLNSNDHQYLLAIFKNDIQHVQQLLGWDCSDWLL